MSGDWVPSHCCAEAHDAPSGMGGIFLRRPWLDRPSWKEDRFPYWVLDTDGGVEGPRISYCPYCGTKLKEHKAEE